MFLAYVNAPTVILNTPDKRKPKVNLFVEVQKKMQGRQISCCAIKEIGKVLNFSHGGDADFDRLKIYSIQVWVLVLTIFK